VNESEQVQAIADKAPKCFIPKPIFGNLQHLNEDTGDVIYADSRGKFFTVADAAQIALDYADLLVRNHAGDIDTFDKIHKYRKLFSEWMPKRAV